MDIKELIEKAVDKIKDDKALQAQFKKDPIKALEKLLGVDLPDDIMEKVVAGVKSKISIDDLGDALGMLKKLF